MNPLPPIVLTDKEVAGALLRRKPAVTRIRHVVSIGAPESQPPTAFAEHPARKLRLVFDDIESESAPNGYEGPSLQHARDVVRFSEALVDLVNPGVVLVHCAAGISRSSAATLILLAVLLGPGREADAVSRLVAVKEQTARARLRAPREIIRPNRRLVWLGDQVLGRDGALLDACILAFAGVYGRSSWSP